jgi:uncharacterized protein YdaU (DUF1376 family)
MKRIWFPLYDGDLVADTMHLNSTAFGCYIRLLIHAYNHHGEIPIETGKIITITKIDPRWWPPNRETILAFFAPHPDDSTRMLHKRVVQELHRSHEISNKRKAAALQMHSKSTCKTDAKGGVITPQSQRKKEPIARSRDNSSTGSGLSLAEQDRLIADYEKRTGKPWQQTRHQHDGISPEKKVAEKDSEKEAQKAGNTSDELEDTLRAKGWI